MPTPSTTAHAQDSSGAPGFQASADLFSGGFKATGHGGSSLKIDAGGDFFSAVPPARPPGALPMKSTSPLQGFGDSSSLVDPVAPLALVPTTLAPAASLGKSPAVSQALPSLSMPQDLGPGLSARAFPGQGQGTPWLQMTPNDVQRYMRVFSKVDTDRDGKITGEQARDLFLSWQLPRGWLASHIHLLKLAVSNGTVEVVLVKEENSFHLQYCHFLIWLLHSAVGVV
jgi:hypothetical protein